VVCRFPRPNRRKTGQFGNREFTILSAHEQPDRGPGHLLTANPTPPAVDGGPKLRRGELSLFNLADNTGETNDLSAKELAKVAELHAKMKAWRNDVGADPMKPNPEHKGTAQTAAVRQVKRQQ